MERLRILLEKPKSWKELQSLTGLILEECGFQVEIEKTLNTVRGKIEADIFAQKTSAYHSILLCECKKWSVKVPQTVIHAFRMVMSDFGASFGFIISIKGFQSGAYEAAQHSNISLYSWEEFLEAFKKEWLQFIINRNYKLGQKILSKKIELAKHQGNAPIINWINMHPKTESDYVFFTLQEHYMDLETREISLNEIDQRIKNYANRLEISLTCYRDFFECIYQYCENLLSEFESHLTNGIVKDE